MRKESHRDSRFKSYTVSQRLKNWKKSSYPATTTFNRRLSARSSSSLSTAASENNDRAKAGVSQSEMTKRRGDPGWKNSSQSPWTSWGHSSAGPASGVDARVDATTSFVHDGFYHHTIQGKEKNIHSGKEERRARETRTKQEYIRWTARASKKG